MSRPFQFFLISPTRESQLARESRAYLGILTLSIGVGIVRILVVLAQDGVSGVLNS
jgi:hypothetical protein